MELPSDIINDMNMIDNNYEQIFGEMCKAGADVVEANIRKNAPSGVKKSPMMNCLEQTRVYKTPSDDGINVRVAFYGYFKNENGKRTPAPLVANVFEYGRSNAPFPKKPFVRRSFNKSQIEKVMREVQVKASRGLLEDE